MQSEAINNFWSNVDKSGSIQAHCPELGNCWIYLKTRDKNGYGRFKTKGQTRRAHRISYELEFGKITEGKMVLHKCDNPPCVRPSHLFEGTAKQNADDMIKKGRAKFTWADSQRSKTHCSRGHKFSQENTYIYKTKTGPGRTCRICRRDHDNNRKTHCVAGHKYSETNTGISGGKRFCKTCRIKCKNGHAFPSGRISHCKVCAKEAAQRYRAKMKKAPEITPELLQN